MPDVSIPQEYTMHVDSSNGMTMGGGIRMTAVGDVNQPIATVMTGNPDKPIGTLVTGNPDKPIGTLVTGDPSKPVGTKITGDPKQPVATTIDMLNIPHLTLNDIKDIMTPKIRVHIPNYEQMSFKVFGLEVFSVCLSGETQMITQPYVPNAYETCKIECPDADDRPFPETPKYDGDKTFKVTDSFNSSAGDTAGRTNEC